MFTIGFIRTDLKYLCRVVFLVEVVVRQTDRHKKKKKKKNHQESFFLLLATYSANFKTVAGLDHFASSGVKEQMHRVFSYALYASKWRFPRSCSGASTFHRRSRG